MKNPPPDAANDRESADPAPVDPEIQALLDFEPVPRQRAVERGWTPENQREFITRLAAHGSATRACDEMAKNQTGVMKLYRSPFGASFRAAWDGAVALAKRRRTEREAALAPVDPDMKPPTVDRRWKHGRYAARGRGSEPLGEEPIEEAGLDEIEAEDEDQDEDEDEAAKSQLWLDGFLAKYWHKVVAEREARLNGEIVAADFYLRQLTFLEVAIDLASGGRGFDQLRRLQRDGHRLSEIAETPFSRIIDDMRRHIWRKMGEPERPEHPPRRLLIEHDGCSTEPLEFTRGGIELGHDEQKARFRRQHEQAAIEQLEWEARAIAEHKQRSAGSPGES